VPKNAYMPVDKVPGFSSRPEDRPDETEPTGPVLVAVDGSDPARRALKWAAKYSQQTGAGLHVVQILAQLRDPNAPPEWNEILVASELDGWLKQHGIASLGDWDAPRPEHPSKTLAATRTVVVGSPPDEIVREAEAVRARLVVLGARRLGWLARPKSRRT
jgi:nucleotide-binding universal stress UspA family protein